LVALLAALEVRSVTRRVSDMESRAAVAP